MDFYDPAMNPMALAADSQQDQRARGVGGGGDDTTTTTATGDAEKRVKEQTLEQEMQQLVAGVSGWWRKSQAQLGQAAAHIQSQGGLVEFAKREAQRFESSMNEAQRAAREKAMQPEPRSDGMGAKGKARATASDDVGDDVGKGEHDDDAHRAREGAYEEGEDDAGEDRELGAARRAAGAAKGVKPSSPSHRLAASEGEELFDADGAATSGSTDAAAAAAPANAAASRHRPRASQDLTKVAAESTGAALGSAQAWLAKVQGTLASDPRVASMQKSLADTLTSLNRTASEALKAGTAKGDAAVGLANASGAADGSAERGAAAKESLKPGAGASEAAKQDQEMLPALTKTVKAALPHLSWDKSQELARRYYHDAEAAVRELGKEMRVFTDDLVKVVPAAPSGSPSSAKASIPSREKGAEATAASAEDGAAYRLDRGPDDELSSDWNMDEPESEQKQGGATPTTPAAAAAAASVDAAATLRGAKGSHDADRLAASSAAPAEPAPSVAAKEADVRTAADGATAAAAKESSASTQPAREPSTKSGKEAGQRAGDEDEDSDWE